MCVPIDFGIDNWSYLRRRIYSSFGKCHTTIITVALLSVHCNTHPHTYCFDRKCNGNTTYLIAYSLQMYISMIFKMLKLVG